MVAEEGRDAEGGKTTDSLSVCRGFGGGGSGGVIGSSSIQLLDYLCSHVSLGAADQRKIRSTAFHYSSVCVQ